MDVDIHEIQSTVKTVDGASLLSPAVMEKIVRAVVKAVRDERDHAARVKTEQQITGGVWAESAREQP